MISKRDSTRSADFPLGFSFGEIQVVADRIYDVVFGERHGSVLLLGKVIGYCMAVRK
jgi:hypothetical protein